MRLTGLILGLGLGAAGAVSVAHVGVENPAVMDRMHGMKASAKALSVLGAMAKGERAFDPAEASAAKTRLSEEAARVVALFQADETDPKSEALPDIWDEFAEFEALAGAAEAAIANLDVTDRSSVRAGLGSVGRACSACHDAYRQPSD